MISSSMRFDSKTGYMIMKFGKIIHPLSAYRLLLDEFDSFDHFRSRFGIAESMPNLDIKERDYIDAYCILFCGEEEYKSLIDDIWETVFPENRSTEDRKKIFNERYKKQMLESCFESFFGKEPGKDQIIEWIESAGDEGNYGVYEFTQKFLKNLHFDHFSS